jgi:hypothetical protein
MGKLIDKIKKNKSYLWYAHIIIACSILNFIGGLDIFGNLDISIDHSLKLILIDLNGRMAIKWLPFIAFAGLLLELSLKNEKEQNFKKIFRVFTVLPYLVIVLAILMRIY